MSGFTEREDFERGFSDVFQRQIQPILDRHEAARRVMKKRAIMWMAVSVGGGIAPALAFNAAGVVWNPALLMILLGVGVSVTIFGAVIIYFYHQKRWRTGLSGEAMPVACAFLGGMEYGRQEIDLRAFIELGMVPVHIIGELEDPVTGRHAGLDYAMTEAWLSQHQSTASNVGRMVTVFRGLPMRIELTTPAPTIFFGRDGGGDGSWFADVRRGHEKIEIDDAAFEAVYETYAEDAAAARAFITPRLTAGLMAVAWAEAGSGFVSAALSGRHLWLALPRGGDFLRMGSLMGPLAISEADFHRLLDDLTLPRRVIDAFRGG